MKNKKTRGTSKGEDSNSEDSIGSASDLQAGFERETREGETETVIDSVMTCGSSAYHAETESMAGPGSAPTSNLNKTSTDVSGAIEERFVGHSYGERPLLADDELDSVSESPVPESSQPVVTDDVFAMAPFPAGAPKARSKKEQRVKQDLFGSSPFNTNPFETCEKNRFTDSEFEVRDFITFPQQSSPEDSPDTLILASSLRKTSDHTSDKPKFNFIEDSSKIKLKFNRHSSLTKKVKGKPISGFSNMSFEDHDDRSHSYVPYEIVKDENDSSDKSPLKYKNNPFS